MKTKTLIILALLILILIPTLSFAGALQEKHRSVIAKKNVPVAGADTISFRSASANHAAASESVEITAPSGITNGDIMVAYFTIDTPLTVGVSTLSGWTAIDNDAFGTNVKTYAFYKIAASESGNYTWATTGAENIAGVILVFSKTGGTWTAPTTAGYYTKSNGSSDTATSTAITTLDGSILVIGFGVDDHGTTVSSAPADMTLNENADAVGSGVATYGYYQAYASGAANVTKSLTWSTSDQWATVAVILGLE